MSTPEEFFEKIDWALLRKQKEKLLIGIDHRLIDGKLSEFVSGIVNLIDGLQDFAADNLGYNKLYIMLENQKKKAFMF